MLIENVAEHLKNNDVKPSFQRIKIFEYLIQNNNHPTVEVIFKNLVDTIPTLSKTTVYNTLKLFIEKDIVKIVNIEDIETRYDADTSVHGHFKCKKCNEIYDFYVDLNKVNIQDLENFNINEYHIYLKGICNKCLTNQIN